MQYYVRKKPRFTLLFEKTTNYKAGPFNLYLRITVDGLPNELSLKRLWEPDRWNIDTGRATGSKEDARQLNNFLDSIQIKIQEARRSLIEENKTITAMAIKNLLSGDTDDRRGILAAFKDHNSRMADLVGQEYSPRTLQRFETTLTHTRSFITWKFKKGDIDIRELDYDIAPTPRNNVAIR